jgi:hypothetical protein
MTDGGGVFLVGAAFGTPIILRLIMALFDWIEQRWPDTRPRDPRTRRGKL